MRHLALTFTVLAFSAQPELANLPLPDPAVVGVEAATQVYLETVPADKRARSDAYFEGGYWLMLWRFLWSSLGLLVLLHVGLSARFRDAAARVTRSVFLQPAFYWVGFTLFVYLFELPLSVYADFLREHQYGLSTQAFGAWFTDGLKALGVEVVLGGFGTVLFYAAVRRAGRNWWVWGTGVAMAFLVFTAMLGPVFIAPIFNTYQPVQDPAIREPILSVARANGIQADEVWEMDASRQTTRISANVSGMLGTERITLNDNLLNRASREAVLAVMGHEMGHYVLNHTYELLLSFGLLIAIAFAAIASAFPALAARHAGRWKVRGVDDPAGLPLIVLLFGVFFSLPRRSPTRSSGATSTRPTSSVSTRRSSRRGSPKRRCSWETIGRCILAGSRRCSSSTIPPGTRAYSPRCGGRRSKGGEFLSSMAASNVQLPRKGPHGSHAPSRRCNGRVHRGRVRSLWRAQPAWPALARDAGRVRNRGPLPDVPRTGDPGDRRRPRLR